MSLPPCCTPPTRIDLRSGTLAIIIVSIRLVPDPHRTNLRFASGAPLGVPAPFESRRPLLAPNSFISHLLRTPGPLSLTEKAPIFLHLWQAQQSLQARRREERQRLVRGLHSACPSSPLKPVTVPVSQPLPSELSFFILSNGHSFSPPPPYILSSCHPRLWIPLRPNRVPPFDEFPPSPRPQLIPSFSPGSLSEYSSARHLRSISPDHSPPGRCPWTSDLAYLDDSTISTLSLGLKPGILDLLNVALIVTHPETSDKSCFKADLGQQVTSTASRCLTV